LSIDTVTVDPSTLMFTAALPVALAPAWVHGGVSAAVVNVTLKFVPGTASIGAGTASTGAGGESMAGGPSIVSVVLLLLQLVTTREQSK
jgi:hypothetical protein